MNVDKEALNFIGKLYHEKEVAKRAVSRLIKEKEILQAAVDEQHTEIRHLKADYKELSAHLIDLQKSLESNNIKIVGDRVTISDYENKKPIFIIENKEIKQFLDQNYEEPKL